MKKINTNIPVICPVCQGRGYVPHGFYDNFSGSTTNIKTEICRTCTGKGVIWKT